MINEKAIVKRSSVLYSKYGIKSVSVDDVALMLGISKKTLYEHIQNKNDLIEKVVENNLDTFFSKISEDSDSEDDIFRKLCTIYLTIIKEFKKINPSYVHDLKKYHSHEYRKIIDFRDNKLYKIVAEIIETGIKAEIFRQDLDTKYVYFNQMHKMSILILDSVYDSSENLTIQIIYKLILNDIRGITTLKGHEIFDRNYEELLQLK